METISIIPEIQKFSEAARRDGKVISLVPTMGYLHEGHLSLVRKARSSSDIVVASIFVNPSQFGPKEDLDHYPRDMEGDSRKLSAEGVDILFAPTVEEMYPPGYLTYVTVEGITDRLCGAHRPGHFRGVATVVSKLFTIAKPHLAFFGQKDYQQTLVIKRLTADLNLWVDIRVEPTVREPDGLAMSSRNAYLSPEERIKASLLYKSLCSAEKLFESGERQASLIMAEMERILRSVVGIDIEYLSVVDGNTLEAVPVARKRDVVALAAGIGRTRLIDNTILY